ncbi:hypothetical protein OG976_25255 [Mycobacterium sp. NBC_00419]|uniref:LGFP repeat-containing protein n=1 Tax=Mycobacterium sp. NBC_00419 TaxID=2975989 RepID=UPI002E22FEE2
MAHTLKSSAVGALLFAGFLLTAPPAGAAPSADAVDAIDAHYEALGRDRSTLGPPVSDIYEVPGGAERDYEGGSIYFSTATGAKALYGPVLDRYQALGGPGGELGFPVTDEVDAGNGVAHVADFSQPGGAAIYWSPQWGAVVVTGQVLQTYRNADGAIGPFSYPSADTTTVNGVETGTFIGPRGTRIAWSAASGVSTVPATLAATLPAAKAQAAQAVRRSQWWWIPTALAGGLAVVATARLTLRRVRRAPAARDAAREAQNPPSCPADPRALFTHEDTLNGLAPR